MTELDEAKIDALFAELNQSTLPGCAVGIAVGGRPVYRKGFGLANMELPVALAPSMRMRIGSTSKHFTCLAYMLLCEEGLARLDDAVGKYLPELPSAVRQATVRQLMGHLSGLRDPFDISWQFSGVGHKVSTEQLLALYRDMDDVNAAPGTSWSYNNGGYLLLSVLIERIAGLSIEDVLRERIFVPAGMHDTMLRRSDDDFVPNSATLHMTCANGGFEKTYLGTEHTGEGGVVSTVNDMLRWLAHMDAPVVGSAATWRLMKTPHVLPNGTSTGYGLGLITHSYRGVETLSHGGGVMGGNSHMLKVPALGLDIALMVNRHDVLARPLVNQILDACIPGLQPFAAQSAAPLATGTFRSLTTGRVIQLTARDGGQIVSVDGSDWSFVRDADGVLRTAAIWGYIRLAVTTRGDLSRPTSIAFSDFGNIDDLDRVEAPARVEAGEIAGSYVSRSTGTRAEIAPSAIGARLVTHGRFGSATMNLECLAPGIWRARFASAWPPGGVLSFDSRGFRFSSARTRALAFERVGARA